MIDELLTIRSQSPLWSQPSVFLSHQDTHFELSDSSGKSFNDLLKESFQADSGMNTKNTALEHNHAQLQSPQRKQERIERVSNKEEEPTDCRGYEDKVTAENSTDSEPQRSEESPKDDSDSDSQDNDDAVQQDTSQKTDQNATNSSEKNNDQSDSEHDENTQVSTETTEAALQGQLDQQSNQDASESLVVETADSLNDNELINTNIDTQTVSTRQNLPDSSGTDTELLSQSDQSTLSASEDIDLDQLENAEEDLSDQLNLIEDGIDDLDSSLDELEEQVSATEQDQLKKLLSEQKETSDNESLDETDFSEAITDDTMDADVDMDNQSQDDIFAQMSNVQVTQDQNTTASSESVSSQTEKDFSEQLNVMSEVQSKNNTTSTTQESVQTEKEAFHTLSQSYNSQERNIIEQVSAQLKSHVRGDIQHSEMQFKLQPGNLGDVSMKMVMIDNALTAKMQVASDTVKTAVEANIEELKKSLNNQGIKVEKIEVTVKSDSESAMNSSDGRRAFNGFNGAANGRGGSGQHGKGSSQMGRSEELNASDSASGIRMRHQRTQSVNGRLDYLA